MSVDVCVCDIAIIIISHSARSAHYPDRHSMPVVRPYMYGDRREIALRRWRYAMTQGGGSTARHQPQRHSMPMQRTTHPNVIPCQYSASAWNLRGVPSDSYHLAQRTRRHEWHGKTPPPLTSFHAGVRQRRGISVACHQTIVKVELRVWVDTTVQGM